MAEVNDRKKMKPVVDSSKVVSSKKGAGSKLAENFIKEDLSEIKDTIIFDWILPGIKNMILNTLSMAFFGEAIDPRDRRYTTTSRYGRTDYGGYSRNRDSRRDLDRRGDRRSNYDEKKADYRSIVLLDRRSAEDVVDALRDEIHSCGRASIAQLFELVQLPSDYTDCDYGWTDERDIDIQRVHDGFLIKVRPARYLD